MNDELIYQGRDLEAMSFAVNYHRQILAWFRPWLGRRIIEVGAGSGSFSELLLELEPESLSMLEPSREMYPLLEQCASQWDTTTRLEVRKEFFPEVAAELATGQPDSIIYVNVMEHVEDDREELRLVHDTLTPGGHVFILVPALSWLYSDFDSDLGHFRRYSHKELRAKCEGAGLRVVASRYFDLPGILPWLIKFRLLRSRTMEPGAVRLYDNMVVPWALPLEHLVSPPLGKNVILVAERGE